MSNLAEPIYFAPAFALLAGARVAIGGRLPEGISAACMLASACVIAIGAFILAPPLPE